jgi:isopenicillin N synthase-like dioxygenase
MLRLLTKTNYFTHSLSKLPIIDLLPYRNGSNDRKHVASEIRKALSNTGFLYVKNHGI